jgi:hypothetical protein
MESQSEIRFVLEAQFWRARVERTEAKEEKHSKRKREAELTLNWKSKNFLRS